MAKLEGVKTLDMVNGEITRVAYGGAAYERVEGKAKEGDLLLMRRAGLDTTKGAFYYTHSTSGRYANIIDDKDEPHDWSREHYDLFRKVSATEPKPERLKVGDYAKVVNADQYTMDGFSVGDIVEIVESEYGEHDVDFYVMSLAGDNSGYIRKTPEYIVRATDEEVAEAKRVAAEAAEHKKWAEIGREVGEYKKGDFVKLTLRSGGIFFGEITEHRGGNTYGFKHLHAEYGTTSEYSRDLTLITPVEARFDR